MAQATLRDLATNEDIVVPPEGFVFGRVGGDADIQLEDSSISRRQARVSLKRGAWLLETIAVAQGQRPPRPVNLQEGDIFAIGQSEFEVVALDVEAEDDGMAKTVAPSNKGKQPPRPAPKQAPAGAQKTTPERSSPGKAGGGGGGGSEAEAKGFGSLFVAVPKGLAYYLLNVPKTLVNPKGSVRSTIDELPNPAMGRIELIGYALPALLATALLGSIATGIATLIAGGGFLFSAFVPIGPAIGAVIGAIVTGFVFHPVMAWIITKLKGHSDDHSRTNFFLQTMTISILVAVPKAIGAIVAALPIAFINLLGPLIMTAASLVAVYVFYRWFVFFEVVDWFRKVILVLGLAAVVFGAKDFVMGTVYTVQNLMSGSKASAVAATDTPDVATPDIPDAPEVPEGQPPPTGGKAPAAEPDKTPEPKQPVKVAAAEPTEPEKPPVPEKTPAPPEKAPVAPERTPEPVAETPPQPSKSSRYGEFARRVEAIEKTFENDPTILDKDDSLQDLYGSYLKATYDVDKKFDKDISKNKDKARLYTHLRDAERFKKTSELVDKIARKLRIP